MYCVGYSLFMVFSKCIKDMISQQLTYLTNFELFLKLVLKSSFYQLHRLRVCRRERTTNYVVNGVRRE